MSFPLRRFDPRVAAAWGALVAVLVIQGALVSHSILWAAPLLCLLLVAVAPSLPISLFLGGLLLIRVLIDERAGGAGRAAAGSNSLAAIGVLLILVAVGLLLQRREGFDTFIFIAAAIVVWTAVAVWHEGASLAVVREGVRELSVWAVAVIAYNSRRALRMPTVARIIQVAGFLAALIAIYQLATGGGFNIDGEMRANGTFVHPNDAVVYFDLAALVSAWRYLEAGRQRLDLAFLLLFSAAALATFSLDGFAALLVMMLAFGALRQGSRRTKVRAAIFVAVLLVAFVASPVGSERIASQTSSRSTTLRAHGASNSFEWRLYKWQTLLPEWERSPVIGKGLGTTTTAEATATNSTVGNLPHNEYVRYLVEGGAIGFGLLLIGLYCLLRALNRRRRAPPDPAVAGVAALGMAAVIGLMVNGFAANTLLYTPPAFAAALVVGACLRSTRPGERPL